jgi:hypothetical protein
VRNIGSEARFFVVCFSVSMMLVVITKGFYGSEGIV